MTISLYSLSAEFQALYDRVAEAAGEITPEVEAAFAELGELEAFKIDAFQHVIAEFAALASMCQGEIERLQEKQQNAMNAAKRLRERLKLYMEDKQVTELKGEIWKAAIVKNGGKRALTLLVEPEQLPAEFQRVAVSANTDRIRELIGEGDYGDVDGKPIAKLEPRGTSLRFK